MSRKLCIAALLLISLSPIAAQNDYDGHLSGMYAGSPMKYGVDKIEDMGFATWQTSFRAELKHKLGIDVIESQLDCYKPVAVKRSSEDVGYAIREKWAIKTEPDVDIPFVLLIPKDMKGPVPLMITPHGHSKNTEVSAGIYYNEHDRESGEDGERNVALQAVQHGFIAIAPTARGFGETRSPKDLKDDKTSSCDDLYLRDALVGRTPVGDRVWDIMKLIDWALENLPVDGRNIIVSGNSGGGTATVYAGAVDTRISMSLPASAYCGYEESIGHIKHCACNYVPGIMELCDMGELAGLTAPRAFCAIHGSGDPIFPIAGTRRVFEVTKKIYGMAGVPDKCGLYVGNGGHRYYKDGAWEFILSHLDDAPAAMLPEWQEGMLDIHFISTGSGNASFMVMPDGTTMLVDAGDLKRPDVRAPQRKPSTSKSVGEWIADYIRQFSPDGKDTELDYALITHFHGDHIGHEANAHGTGPGGYALSGITEVGTLIPIHKLVNRDETIPGMPAFCRDFIEWQCKNNGMVHETARVGSSDQFALTRDKSSYPDFNIRVLFSHGQVAARKGEKVAAKLYKKGKSTSENNLSVGIRLDYGKFNFYTGGDISGVGSTGATTDEGMESLAARLIGPVDVAVLNHHGNRDTQSCEYISAVRPRVWIGACWGVRHPGEETIRRLSNRSLYDGDRDIYTTYMGNATREFMGRYLSDYKSLAGHIVVRVAPGGDSYDVYVLNDGSSIREVLSVNHYESQ